MMLLISTMDKYLQEIDKRHGDRTDLMNYEWARFESFKVFPATSCVSTIRLAQAGFYYSGAGEEAVCFCCGLRHNSWSTDETIMEIHKRLSPNCGFINGNENTNVPSHCSNEQHVHAQDSLLACASIMQTLPQLAMVECNEINDHSVEGVLNQHTSFQNGQPESEENETQFRNSLKEPIRNAMQREHTYTSSGIMQPNHPDYTVKSVRLSSFIGWSYTHVVDPVKLAEAGLFYTGVHDCVRCFFCGGGLKHWETTDDPWVEHAKWYPQCAYVLQCKGDAFVAMCGMHNMNVISRNSSNAQEEIKNNSQGKEPCSMNNDTCDLFEDIASDAVKIIQGLGYSIEEIVQGILEYRNKYGSVPLRPHELLEIILDLQSVSQLSQLSTTSRISHEAASNQSGEHASLTSSSETLNTSTKFSGVSEKSQTALGPSVNKKTIEYQSLIEENRVLREQTMCKICMDKDACIVFLPCGHMVSCVVCAQSLRKCCICRKIIRGTVKAFPS